ncbi:MAG: hypothetical protein KA713_09605 [Chryseotalea sp. WA131a]|nr:MAG: hypothetical protein KA713_09605 [Chryseotalea sp. WA131a]
MKYLETKDILKGQTLESGIVFWLKRNSFCSPTINFPFNQADDKFWDYVKTIEPYLPFKFDPKNLRRVTKNKKGTGYVWRKL